MVNTNSSIKSPTIPYSPKAAGGPIKQSRASPAVPSTAHLTYRQCLLSAEKVHAAFSSTTHDLF